MSMYAQFQTDETLETKGVIIDYGQFRVTLARAGGANKKYSKVMESKAKPFRRAIQTETLDNDVAMKMLRESFAEACVLNWEVKGEDEEWTRGIEGKDGDLLDFNRDNVIATFENLPDLFSDLQEQANKVSIYREEILEQDSGN